MRKRTISITGHDLRRLRSLLEKTHETHSRDRRHLEELEEELEKAVILQPHEVPQDLVTMNSHVRLVDLRSGRAVEYTLVFPKDADSSKGRISVLAPIGTAMLGYRRGDTFVWRVPSGLRRFKVEAVLFQPEAALSRAG